MLGNFGPPTRITRSLWEKMEEQAEKLSQRSPDFRARGCPLPNPPPLRKGGIRPENWPFNPYYLFSDLGELGVLCEIILFKRTSEVAASLTLPRFAREGIRRESWRFNPCCLFSDLGELGGLCEIGLLKPHSPSAVGKSEYSYTGIVKVAITDRQLFAPRAFDREL
jgi:hypothetical protein